MASGGDERIEYPATRKDNERVLSNTPVPVPDEFGWLEDPDSAETREWVTAQNEVFDRFLEPSRRSGLLARIKATLTGLLDFPRHGAPFHKAGRFYYYKNDGLQNQSVLYTQSSLDGPSEVFLDPNKLSDDGTASLGSTAFDEQGAYFAYGVQLRGSDWQTIRVLRVADRTPTDDQCEYVKFTSIAWTHDSQGFFYCRYPPPATDMLGTETDKNVDQKVYYHALGTPQSDDLLVWEAPEHPEWLFGVTVTDDGKYLVVTTSFSCEDVNQVHIVPLDGVDLRQMAAAAESGESLAKQLQQRAVALIDTFESSFSYLTNEGSTFWFQTKLDAPRGALLCVDVARPELHRAPRSWTTVIAQHPVDVLSSVTVVRHNLLVACYMKDVTDRIYLFDMQGASRGEVQLPSLGTIYGLSAEKKDSFLFFKFVSFLTPGTILRIDFPADDSAAAAAAAALSVHREIVAPGIVPADFVTEQIWYTNNKDGTRLPMFLVRHKSVPLDAGDVPVYLYGYGGFNISIQPSFSSFWTFFLQYFRGVLAVPSLRGGGEYGEDWHHQGTKQHKQNVFDDFCSAAEYLVAAGVTRPSRITINGGSNGGLLVGACVNQRPELFGCAVAQVGVFDMLQFHKFTIGYAWTSDYGCADNKDDFDYLVKYSPLHNVRVHPDHQYPALLLVTGDHDDRVVPLHSLKFGAKLQTVVGADPKQTNPLLLRVECKAGHGAGKPLSKQIDENSDILAFIAQILNITPQNLREPAQ